MTRQQLLSWKILFVFMIMCVSACNTIAWQDYTISLDDASTISLQLPEYAAIRYLAENTLITIEPENNAAWYVLVQRRSAEDVQQDFEVAFDEPEPILAGWAASLDVTTIFFQEPHPFAQQEIDSGAAGILPNPPSWHRFSVEPVTQYDINGRQAAMAVLTQDVSYSSEVDPFPLYKFYYGLVALDDGFIQVTGYTRVEHELDYNELFVRVFESVDYRNRAE